MDLTWRSQSKFCQSNSTTVNSLAIFTNSILFLSYSQLDKVQKLNQKSLGVAKQASNDSPDLLSPEILRSGMVATNGSPVNLRAPLLQQPAQAPIKGGVSAMLAG